LITNQELWLFEMFQPLYALNAEKHGLNDDMSAKMEEIVEEARAKHKQFEVIDIAA